MADNLKVALTAKLVKALKYECRPIGVDNEEWVYPNPPIPTTTSEWLVKDTVVSGLAVRLQRGGKRFIVQRRGGGARTERYVLTEQRDLKEVRREAQRWLGKIANGEDPREERLAKTSARTQKAALEQFTFGVAYTECYGVPLPPIKDGNGKPSKGIEYPTVGSAALLREKSYYDRQWAGRWLKTEPIWKVPLYRLSKSDVATTFVPIFKAAQETRLRPYAPGNAKSSVTGKPSRTRGGGPRADVASAHRILRHAHAAWNSTEHAKREANPFGLWRREMRKQLPKVKWRDTILPLHDEKGRAWLKALVAMRDDSDFSLATQADYLICVLFWGGRRHEIQALRWGDINEHANTVKLREEHAKTKRDLWLPLTAWPCEILKERRRRNDAAGYSAEPDGWVFPSTIEGAMHIVDIRGVQKKLRAQSDGLWIGPHDLRRTLAADIFGGTQNMKTVGLALGHASADADVSAGYVPDEARLTALRPLYEQRDRRLKALAGLVPPDQSLSTTQAAIIQAAQAMLKQAGVSLDVVKLLAVG